MFSFYVGVESKDKGGMFLVKWSNMEMPKDLGG